jgi:hypothetical protein
LRVTRAYTALPAQRSNLADGERTAWAEWYRMLGERALPPRLALRRDLWRIDVTLEAAADVSTAERLGRLGLGRPVPSRSMWPAYQEAGERPRAHGFDGLVAPGAAGPVGRVRCVFMPASAGALARSAGRGGWTRRPRHRAA